MQILALLEKEGPTSKTIIYDRMSKNARAALDRLKTLSSLGLIQEVKRPSNPKETTIQLTKRGKKVAEKIIEIEKLLEGQS